VNNGRRGTNEKKTGKEDKRERRKPNEENGENEMKKSKFKKERGTKKGKMRKQIWYELIACFTLTRRGLHREIGAVRRDTNTQHGDLIRLILFSENKESKLRKKDGKEVTDIRRSRKGREGK
jgi:hypothetical protein